MKFFVPHTSSDAEAEQAWEGVRQFVGGSPDRRIFRLVYESSSRGYTYTAEVGKPESAVPITRDEQGKRKRPRRRSESGSEPVMAIFESGDGRMYFVCKPTRGVLRDHPIQIAGSEVRDVEDFE